MVRLTIGLMLFALPLAPVAAEVLIQESFEYEAGELDSNNGGVGFDAEWITFSEFIFDVVEMDTPMQYSVPGGGVINGGDSALMFENDSIDLVLANEVDALTRDFADPIEDDVVYFSYLYRYSPDGFIDDNDFVVWWFNDVGGPQIGLKGNGGDGSVPDDIVGRVNGQFAPPHQAYVEESDISDDEGNLGDDLLIVGRMSKSDLSDFEGDYDEFAVWVNPSAADENSPHAVAEANPEDQLFESLDRIGLRAFSQEPGDAMYWDALRIGQTWEDVTSAFGTIQGPTGDIDGDGELGVGDIDALTAAIQNNSNDAGFDLNGDLAVDDADRTVWVTELKKTWFGDANLDGEFNSADFVFVFQKGEYEDSIDGNSTWGDGDSNGDGDFDSSDFVTAFQGGGFEVGPRAASSAVPEPPGFSMLLLAALGLIRIRTKNARTN